MAGALKLWNGEEDIIIGGFGELGAEAVKTGNIANGAVTKEKLDPNLQLDSNDVYIGSETPTGDNLPKLWVNPADTTLPLTMKLLWENANPASDFPAQTVSVDYTGYDYIYLIAITGSTTKNTGTYQSVVMVPAVVGVAGNISSFAGGDVFWGHTRTFSLVDGGVQFANGHQISWSSSNTLYANWANRAVPVAIFGIKGVN